MNELTGLLRQGLTIIYGDLNSGRTSFVNLILNKYSKTDKILLITSHPEVDFFDNPDNVLIANPANFEELKHIMDSAFVSTKIVIVDTITDISRREGSNGKALANFLSEIKSIKPVLLIADMYIDFSTNELRLPSQAVIRYFADTLIEFKRETGMFKATKYYPIKETANFTIIPPIKKLVLV